MRVLTQTVLCLLVLVLSGIAAAATIYVDDNAPNDPGPGDPTVSDPLEDGSADHPFDAIQEGIDAAVNGDSVEVAQGTYTGNGNRDLDYNGKAITVRSTDPSNPDVVDATVINCQGTELDPHRAFHFHTSETTTSVLSGLTIINGYVNGGGAIRIHNSSPTISYCALEGNTSTPAGGGAIMCVTGLGGASQPALEQCTFTLNTASHGGAILFGAGSSADVTGCTFETNSADQKGGAVTCIGGIGGIADANFEGCLFEGNTSSDFGGAIGVATLATAELHHCILRNNSATSAGGAIFVEDELVVEDCTISGNETLNDRVTWHGGGGIFVDAAARVTVRRTQILQNTSATFGGGVRDRYDGVAQVGAVVEIDRCTIESNEAIERGGGLYLDSGASTRTVRGSRICSNKTTAENPDSGRGGGIHCYATGATVSDCVIEGNTSVREGAGVYSTSSVTLAACVIRDNEATDGASYYSGGGVYSTGDDTAIANCAITGNKGSDGGGIYLQGYSPVVQNCTLNSNEGADGGGIYILSGGEPTITNCTIGGDTQEDGNTASGFGAGIYIAGGSPRIVGCRIKHNRTTANGNGGGIWSSAWLTLESCTIAGNSTAGTGNGGGLCVSGSSTIFNCLIVDNTAGANGGGAWCTTDDATFLNCTFSANEAVDGGALYRASGATPAVTYCILWGDTATGPMGVDEISPFPDRDTTTYCDIEGGSLGLGNFSADPLFVSGPNHDYYLSWTEAGQYDDSPCVNAGDVESKDLGLDKFTTRTDERVDTGEFVDLGYHDPGTTAIDDVYWDQTTTSTVLIFTTMESLGVDPLQYTVEYADGDEYWSGLGWSELTTVTGMATPTTITDDLTTNPLTGAYRFYRVRRADGLAYSPETAGVFEMPIDAGATTLYFISTPLVPDPDHNSVPAVFGEGAARQIVRSNVTVSDLDESNGAINRMRNASGTYTVLAGSAFDIEAGVGYELYVGLGFLTDFTLRLTGYVPETALTLPLIKENNQAVRWMGYSLPRTIKLSELGLVEAVTPVWSPTNKVRLLPPASPSWFNYQYDTVGGFWYDPANPGVEDDPDLLPGMGIQFIRAGFDNLTDKLVLPTWYLHPPNIW